MESLNPSGLRQCGCGQPAPFATKTRRCLGHIKGTTVRFIRGHHNVGKRWHWRNRNLNPVVHRSDGVTEMTLFHKQKPLVCLLWTEDYDKVKDERWHADWSSASRTFYVGNSQKIKMHRVLLPNAEEVDHKNHSGLDNRVYDATTDTGNIRPATHAQNSRNRRTRRDRRRSSIFKGVSKHGEK